MRYSFLLLLFFPFLSFSQIGGSDGFSNLQSLASGSEMFRSFDDRFKGVEGYPTLFEQYVPGKITLSRGREVIHPLVNYDIFSDELVVRRNNQDVVVSRSMVKSFVLLNVEDSLYFVKVRFKDGEKFCEELLKGRLKLYKLNSKSIKQANHTGAYSSGKLYSQFEESVTYYWQSGENDPVEIKNKKTLVDELKAAHGVDVSGFVKDNHINFKDSADLLKMFTHVNSLL
jgi:hypothetical protein